MARNRTIDVARGIAILLVVIGHNRIGEVAKAFLYSFHVHTFFLLTGATFNFTKYRNSLASLISERFRRLVLPYLFSAVVFFVFWYFVARHFGEDAGREIPVWKPLVGILYANGVGDWLIFNAPLWFLPALFIAGVLLWVALRLTDKANAWTQVAVIFGAAVAGYLLSHVVLLPWGADLALVTLVFMYLGYELNRRGLLRDDAPLVSLFGAALAAGLFTVVVMLNGHVDLALRWYHNFALFVLAGISGGILVLYVSNLITRWERITVLFSYLGRESLIILIFHLLGMQVLSAIVAFGLGQEPEPLMRQFWWAWVMAAVVFSLIAAAVIKRIPPLRAIYYGSPGPRGRLRAAVPPGTPELEITNR